MDRTAKLGGCQTRRKLLQATLALAGLCLLSACGIFLPQAPQPTNVHWVGFLSGGSSDPSMNLEAFRDGLRELGWIEGQNLAIDYRYADGRADRLPGLAAELVQVPVEVIVTAGTPPTRAAMQATTTIPIVMATSSDPVSAGLVASLARPGGNVTGLTNISSELSAKRLELLKEALPGASRVAVLWNSIDPIKQEEFRNTQVAARTLGLELQSLAVRSPDDFEQVFDLAARDRAGALLTFPDFLINSRRRQVVDFATRNRLPAIYPLREYADDGGLAAYGPNLAHQFRRAATYVDKVLKGANPADLPVEQPTRFDFVINLKTAQAFGLTIPPPVLAQATELIQ